MTSFTSSVSFSCGCSAGVAGAGVASASDSARCFFDTGVCSRSSSGSGVLSLRLRPICGAVDVAAHGPHSSWNYEIPEGGIDRGSGSKRMETKTKEKHVSDAWHLDLEHSEHAPSSLHGLSGRGKNPLDIRRMSLYMASRQLTGRTRRCDAMGCAAAGVVGERKNASAGNRLMIARPGARDATWRPVYFRNLSRLCGCLPPPSPSRSRARRVPIVPCMQHKCEPEIRSIRRVLFFESLCGA